MSETWELAFLPEARDDLKHLGRSQQLRVLKAIDRVRTNPLPRSEGGYGSPLGNKFSYDLTGLLKIKLKSDGIRVVYKAYRQDGMMLVVIIGMRADEEVYREAARRKKQLEST